MRRPSNLPATGYILHVGIAKPLLLTLIRNTGHVGILRGWTGRDADAYAAVLADARQVFVLEACDRQGPDGACLGHPREAESAERGA